MRYTNGRVYFTLLSLLSLLLVRQRIKFKTAVLVYKCLHGMAPPYLISYCTPVSAQTGRSNLRSATTGQLVVPRTRTVYGSRSFAVHGPVVWNSLPAELRSPDMTPGVFRKQLKTHLFNCMPVAHLLNFRICAIKMSLIIIIIILLLLLNAGICFYTETTMSVCTDWYVCARWCNVLKIKKIISCVVLRFITLHYIKCLVPGLQQTRPARQYKCQR